MGVPNTSISYLINHSLPHFRDKPNFEAYYDLQNYTATDYWFSEDRYTTQSGKRVEWRVIPDPDNGSARYVDKFEATPRIYRNVMQRAFAEWCYAEATATYEERTMREMSDESEIYDYLKAIYFDGKISLMNLLETSCLGVPASASDGKTPMGFFYWINYLNSGTTDFVGQFGGQTAIFGDAATTTTIGGISTQTYPKHRNWAFNHSGMNMQTIDAIRLACLKTGFTPPRDVREYQKPKAKRFAIYSSLDYKSDYARLVNAGPDNRNGDLNPFSAEGALTFMGYDWNGAAVLDGATYNPICGIDRNNFQPIVMSGNWMQQSKAMRDPDRRHVWTVYWDCQYNFGVRNKRAGNWVGHTAF